MTNAILTALTVLGASFSLAEDGLPIRDGSRVVQCQALLWHARNSGHSIPSLSRTATREAVEAFGEFAERFLPELGAVNPSDNAVSSFIPQDAKSFTTGVAARVAGIESNYADSASEGLITLGNSFSGEDSVAQFATDLQKHISDVSARGFTGESRRSREMEAVGAALMSGVTAFGLGLAAGAHQVIPAANLEIVGLSVASIGMLASAASYVGREVDALEFARHFRNTQDSYVQQFIGAAEKSSEQGNGRWIYHSFNGELPAFAIKGILKGGNAAREIFRSTTLEKQTEYFYLLGPIAMFRRKLVLPLAAEGQFINDMEKVRVLWDAVYYKDEQGTPHVVTMLRTELKVPRPQTPHKHSVGSELGVEVPELL